MDKVLEDNLTEKYFCKESNIKMGEPLSEYGIQCDSGWHDIIYDMLYCMLGKPVTVYINQIKEKFGGLRVHYTCEDSNNIGENNFRVTGINISTIVKNSENESWGICEVCGNDGRVRNDKHHKCLCITHYIDYLKD